jgi:mRNA-degrading endonuclease toxin of MazEF toxin-antitoxin module
VSTNPDIATKGAHTGKPRAAVTVQADIFNPVHASVTLCPITSECIDAALFGNRGLPETVPV